MEADPLRDASGPLPSYIDAAQAVEKRLNQVADLVDVIHRGGRDHRPRTVVQRLPRHMRRRAMSHNVKRLPRRSRDFGRSVISKSKHRKKPPSRMARRRPRNLAKVYNKRSVADGGRWLHTHIWHAKRFEMIQLWGHKIPLRSYQRGVRPFMRAARDHVVMFDDSYFTTLKLQFKQPRDARQFAAELQDLANDDFFAISKQTCARAGVRVVVEDLNNSLIVISIHPLFLKSHKKFLEQFELIQSVEEVTGDRLLKRFKELNYVQEKPLKLFESPIVSITDESNLYAKFTLYGANSLPSLNTLLDLVSDAELDKHSLSNFKPIHAAFRLFAASNATAQIGDEQAFSLLIEDPRVMAPKKLNRTLKKTDGMFIEHWENAHFLYDIKAVDKLHSKRMSDADLIKLKAHKLAAIRSTEHKVPILVVIRNKFSAPKLEIHMPAYVARCFFAAFARAGIRVGALSDRFVLCNEINDFDYPYFWLPLTTVKPQYRWRRYAKMKDKKFTNLNEFNDLGTWRYVLGNPVTLSSLQIGLKKRVTVSLEEILDSVLVPVKVRVPGKGRVTDDDLIYTPEKSQKKRVSFVDADLFKYDPMTMELHTGPPINMASLFAPPAKKPRIIPKKVEDRKEPTRILLGRIVHSTSSLHHGVTEALGFIDIKHFGLIMKHRGVVDLKNPKGQSFVRANLDIVNCDAICT